VNAEIMLSVAEDLGFAAVTIPDSYWEIAPGEPCYYWLPDHARLQLVSILSRMAVSEVMVIAANGAVMGMPGPAEFVAFCYKLIDAPEEVDERAKTRFAAGLESARQMRDAGAEALYAAADIADNHGPFYNPQQMDRFVLPYLRDWAEQVKAMGLYAIFHTDGQVDPLLQDLVDTGIHALQAIDSVAGMDIRKVKGAVGNRLCLCGNVDCGLLYTGPAEAIYAGTRDLLRDCMPGGGFVLGASNAVLRETPIENYRTMIDAWRDFGQYQP
jgi:uroporphyrinogen decarboxylase